MVFQGGPLLCTSASRLVTEGEKMKIGARNRLKGTVVYVVKGAVTADVRIDVGDRW
jgi:hypothetical protein